MVAGYVLSIDPGKSTGAALLAYDDDKPAWLEYAWQFGGGVVGVDAWVNAATLPLRLAGTPIYGMGGAIRSASGRLTAISEKFTARNTRGFSYTTDSLEPLRCEGALIAKGLMPDYSPEEKRWRDPNLQYFAGGTGKAEKKKRQHAWLKANGFYRTGKDLMAPDADDFRSACAHGIAYIARELKHKPTFDLMRGAIE